MEKLTKDILIVIAIFLAGFLTAYYLYALQEWPCPSSAITGNSVKAIPLFDKNYASTLISEINNAKTSIDMAMFEFKFYDSNGKTRQVLNALVNASSKGVSVRILLDSSDWSSEVTKENNQTINFLKENGVDAKLDNPKRTLHSKIIIVDNKVFVGSHNLVFHALERNNEASILIENSDITEEYKNYFEWLWQS